MQQRNKRARVWLIGENYAESKNKEGELLLPQKKRKATMSKKSPGDTNAAETGERSDTMNTPPRHHHCGLVSQPETRHQGNSDSCHRSSLFTNMIPVDHHQKSPIRISSGASVSVLELGQWLRGVEFSDL
uniref:Uncharacterized protein n=1 Tax=Pseudictyota dubia TaxID=2749911 RepID=A0A7R9WJL0_9STRA